MKKNVLSVILLLLSWSFLTQTVTAPVQLTLQIETPTFRMFCTDADKEVAAVVFKEYERSFAQLSNDFQHTYSTQITLEMYPDIDSFHAAVGKPNAPQWFCGQNETEKHTEIFVSPNNPGSYHTYTSILRQIIIGLTGLFIHDAYKNDLPRWLYQGIGYLKADYSSIDAKKNLAQIAHDPSQLPTLDQLSDPTGKDEQFSFVSAATMVEFLNEKWGWKTILALLADYQSFEKILGISPDMFHQQWAAFLVEKYGN